MGAPLLRRVMTRPGRPTPGPWPGVRAMTLVASVALFLGCTASEAPNVAAPPAIVFDWLRNGNRDIYRAALDGKDTVRLTSDAGDDQHPTERAGTVVFTSYRDGHAQLYAVAATGGGTARRVTNTAFNETQPALSPDGTEIAYLTDSSGVRSGEHTSELQSHSDLVCRLLLEKKNKTTLESLQADTAETVQ